MAKVKAEMFFDVEDHFVDEIKKIEHHAEILLDLDSYPEIKSVYGVKVEEVKS